MILHYLKQNDGRQVDLRTLVDSVSAWEYDSPAEDLSWKERKRVYTALRQSHLPKLDDAGVVDYDQSRGTVSLTEDAREVQMYLEYVPAHDIPWSQYYVGLTGVAGTLTLLTWLSVYPFAHLSGTALAAILVVMFGVSAVVHNYHRRRNHLGAGDEPPR